jgi:hypothetical protein
MTVKEVLVRDAREFPADFCQGAKESFCNPVNFGILVAAHGADRVVRHNLDGDVRRRYRDHGNTSLHETGDFGGFVSNPFVHFAVAGAWYAAAVGRRDDRHHEMSKTLIEALTVNGLATWTLKAAMYDESPNGEDFGWPSGHTSSAFCFASVMHEYYGWKAGIPLYVLAAYGAASRVEDQEHDVSDVVFGTALGLVVGHSMARGHLPQVGGFTVLPYGGPEASGVMLLKRW